jgi:hypothetical protein
MSEPPLPAPPPSKIPIIARLKSHSAGVSARIDQFNDWIAKSFQALFVKVFQTEQFTATRKAVLAIEALALFSVGATLMQIGESAFAIAMFVILGFLLIAKSFTLNIGGRLVWLVRSVSFFSSAALCVLLITIPVLRKPEGEPWTNLQKLWRKPIQAVAPESKLVDITPEVKIVSSLNLPGALRGMTFSITDGSSIPIESIDVTVNMDTPIAAINQLSDVPEVQFLTTPNAHPMSAEMNRGGKPQQIPANPSWKNGSIMSEARIYCAKLLVGQSLIVDLTSGGDLVTRGPNGKLEFAKNYSSPREPKSLRIKGTFETGGADNPRRYPINYDKYFNTPAEKQ